jgi:hypothetical protein
VSVTDSCGVLNRLTGQHGTEAEEATTDRRTRATQKQEAVATRASVCTWVAVRAAT